MRRFLPEGSWWRSGASSATQVRDGQRSRPGDDGGVSRALRLAGRSGEADTRRGHRGGRGRAGVRRRPACRPAPRASPPAAARGSGPSWICSGSPTACLKENVLLEGINLESLEAGQRLHLGDEVVIELTDPCVPCSKLERIRPGLMQRRMGTPRATGACGWREGRCGGGGPGCGSARSTRMRPVPSVPGFPEEIPWPAQGDFPSNPVARRLPRISRSLRASRSFAASSGSPAPFTSHRQMRPATVPRIRVCRSADSDAMKRRRDARQTNGRSSRSEEEEHSSEHLSVGRGDSRSRRLDAAVAPEMDPRRRPAAEALVLARTAEAARS
jgi:hypothetical protein